MTTEFERASAWTREAEGVYAGTFDAGWFQGRGAYGGLVAAVVLRAMIDVVGDAARPVRSFTIHFCAPATANASVVRARVERRGFLVTHVSARLEQGDQTVCIATATFAVSKGADAVRYAAAVMPDAPPVESFDGDSLEGVPGVPVFTQHFRFLMAVGRAPFSSAPESRLGGWLQLKEPPAVLDAPGLVGLIDAYPPAVFTRFDRPRPSVSVDFRVEFYAALPRADASASWYLLELRSDVAGDGYTNETVDLWSADGTLLARCHQLVAVLG